MKELSFLMFIIALLFGVMVLARHLTNPNHPDRTVFFIPSRMLFNVLWGSIFYIGYGILVYHDFHLRIGLSVLNGVVLGYTLFLIQVQKHLLHPEKPMPQYMSRFLEGRITAQQKIDELNHGYTIRKSLKILGLGPSAIDTPEIISQRITALKGQQQHNLNTPYLELIIKQCEDELSRLSSSKTQA